MNPQAEALAILIVDGDAQGRGELQSRLQAAPGWSLTIDQAKDFAAALLTFKERSFDLVFLARRLPNGESLSLLDRVRQLHPKSAIIVTCAEPDTAWAVAAMKKGALDCLVRGDLPRIDFGPILGRLVETRNLINQNMELRQVNQMKNEFIANVSHELRAPLTVVLGYARSLQDGTLGDLTAEQKKAELKVGIEYGKAIAEAETALSQNQMMAAADAYDKALKLKSTPELAEKVKDLRYNYNLEQGRQHMTTGQVELALDEFNKAKECRDTPEVQAELAEASKLKDYQGLTQAGDKLLAEKKFDDAIEKYHAAAGVRPGDEIKAKLADAQYAKAMYEGDQAVAAKDWAKAEASYRRADAARPNTPEARARIEQVQLEKKYSDLMNQAEAARAKGNYGEALNRLTAAKNVLDKPEVRERINEVKYQDNLQRGKQELADQNYVQALAYFKLARSFRQTPEVEKLIEDASKRPQ